MKVTKKKRNVNVPLETVPFEIFFVSSEISKIYEVFDLSELVYI